VGDFTGSKTFTLTCSNGNASAFDSVTLDGSDDSLEVSAGSDKDVDSDESVRLDGSVEGDYDSLSWHCTGGSLSDYNTLRPTFRAPFSDSYYNNNDERTYTCTLTARNECGSDSDSVKINVDRETSDFNVSLTARPKSDCAPFNNVDLIAALSNYGGDNHNYTYSFDCENDGIWDKTVTTSNTSYTAVDLCDYHNAGSYTAKVRVESSGRTATDSEIVRADVCNVIPRDGQVSITKTVSNLSLGGGYQGTVSANPLNIVAYRIVVTGVCGTTNNVTVVDAVPAGITNIRDLQVDGYAVGGNLVSGISLGTISAGQTKTIAYTGTVANEANFIYGQTTLNNVATVTVDGKSATSNAVVVVSRRAVMGATVISTGFDGNLLVGLGIGLVVALVWVALGG
jgi:hypothetical protein